MILYLVLFYFLGVLTASNSINTLNGTDSSNNVTTGASNFSKSIMCLLKGNLRQSDARFVDLDLKNIPQECEVLIYSQFSIDSVSKINVDEVYLKSVVDLNKTVILLLQRENGYSDWATILGGEGKPGEVEVLINFAKKHNITGYLIDGLTPENMCVPFRENVAKHIIPYIKQLKWSPDFIIGVTVQPQGSAIQNPCMYNFKDLNNLVDFYEIQTSYMNPCDPKSYNGMSPITRVDHGANYMFGMEEVAYFLNKSKISLTKTTYDIDLIPMDMSSNLNFNTYGQVCKNGSDTSNSCIQTTKNLYEKGMFAQRKNSGVMVVYIDLDDHKDDCGCKPFVGLKNIVAGLHGGQQAPCPKFDVQSTTYNFK